MFDQDFDDDNRYPVNGTLEEKAIHSLESIRHGFWWAKKNYLETREGGPRHTAQLMAFGQKSADQMAKHAEIQFKAFCNNAFLTENGETTDPKYPTTKMIDKELRRIRALIILNVSQYMTHFESMMDEDTTRWTYDMLYFNLYPYTERYMNETYEQINLVIPGKQMPARSVAAVEDHIDQQAKRYSDAKTRSGYSKEFLARQIRDELIIFLLQDLPFNNVRLQKKDELIAKPEEANGEEKKTVLH